MLDTSILIAAEKRQLVLRSLIGHDDPAIAAMTAAEMLVGVEGWPPQWRDERSLRFEGYFLAFPIESFTLEVARMHASLSNHARKTGHARSTPDLIIAATAAVTGRTLLTADKAAAFDALPGVKAELVKLS